jgi:Tol biopolymer transport system component
MSSDGGQAHLYLRDPENSHSYQPTWFPSGKRIALARLKMTDGALSVSLESRNLQGTDPVTLASNPRSVDFCIAPNNRVIYAIRELPPNQYDANLWQVRFDPDSGKPIGSPRKLTDWTGFTFGNPTFTADGNRFSFLNNHAQSDVYIAELTDGGTALKPAQRMTLNDRVDWPGGWTADSKSILFYSDRNGNLDIYKQGMGDHNAEAIASGPGEKWTPQLSPDGKWILYLQWAATADGVPPASGKLMRVPAAGGPAEAVTDVRGHPGYAFGGYDPVNTAGGFPSFHCASASAASCVLAESGDHQIIFTAIDPAQGRKAELSKVSIDPDSAGWDLSPDGSRIALTLFDYKLADVQIVPVAGGAAQHLSALPWTQLSTVAWAADGKSLFLCSFSSRGTSIVHMDMSGATKLLFKEPSWDIFALSPSPNGHSLAFGPIINSANAWTIAAFPQK